VVAKYELTHMKERALKYTKMLLPELKLSIYL